MRAFFFKKHKGVTLMELMVVIGIMSIMTGVAFVSLQDSRTESEVRAAAREVAAAVRSVQNDAISGKKIKNGLCSSPTKEYIFYYGTNATLSLGAAQYKIEGCNAQDAVTLEKGVTFSTPPGSVSFAPVTGNTPGGNITVTKDGTSYSVCVSAVGKVTEENSATCP